MRTQLVATTTVSERAGASGIATGDARGRMALGYAGEERAAGGEDHSGSCTDPRHRPGGRR